MDLKRLRKAERGGLVRRLEGLQQLKLSDLRRLVSGCLELTVRLEYQEASALPPEACLESVY